MSQIKPNLLFSPGPTIVSPKTLEILSQPTEHHRTLDFKQQFGQTLTMLKQLFQTTTGHVFGLTSTGTGAMEASIVNLLNPGEKILYYNAGKFGERWGEMARAFKLVSTEIKQEWGSSFSLLEFEEKLKAEKYSAFFIQACETSTATAQPLDEISKLLKKIQPDCLLIVDGITAVGAYDLPMDDLGIDALISGSQKALGLPTGMSFVGFSKRALLRISQVQQPRFYFDLAAEKKANDQMTTNFSTPVAQILALNFKLNFILECGLNKYFLKTKTLQENTGDFLLGMGCSLLSLNPSPSLTAFSIADPSFTDELQKKMKSDGLYLAGGQDHLKGNTLRWGHMGDITIENQIQAYRIFAKHACEMSLITKAQAEKVVTDACDKISKMKLIDECVPQ